MCGAGNTSAPAGQIRIIVRKGAPVPATAILIQLAKSFKEFQWHPLGSNRFRLLILDEPTEGIQPSIIKEIGNVISALTQSGEMAILLLEQYYDFAKSLADHYLVMSRGEIIKQGLGRNMDAEEEWACIAL